MRRLNVGWYHTHKIDVENALDEMDNERVRAQCLIVNRTEPITLDQSALHYQSRLKEEMLANVYKDPDIFAVYYVTNGKNNRYVSCKKIDSGSYRRFKNCRLVFESKYDKEVKKRCDELNDGIGRTLAGLSSKAANFLIAKGYRVVEQEKSLHGKFIEINCGTYFMKRYSSPNGRDVEEVIQDGFKNIIFLNLVRISYYSDIRSIKWNYGAMYKYYENHKRRSYGNRP